MSFYKKYLKYKKKYTDLKIQMGGALKPLESAVQAKEATDLRVMDKIFNERFKTNEEFERIKNNVWDELIKLNTSLNEECEMSVWEEGKRKIKEKFGLTRSITNPTQIEYLKNKLNDYIKWHLEWRGIKIKLKLLRVPFFALHSLKRKVRKCVNQTESKRSVNQTESKRSVNEEKSRDEILLERLIKFRDENEDPVIPLGNPDHIHGFNKISEWLLTYGIDANEEINRLKKEKKLSNEIKLERERHIKGLYTYNKFEKGVTGHYLGLDITVRSTFLDEIGTYVHILTDRDIGEWIFTIVKEEDPTTLTVTGNTDGEKKNPTTLTQTENPDGEENNLITLNDLAYQTGVITTPYLTVTGKTDE